MSGERALWAEKTETDQVLRKGVCQHMEGNSKEASEARSE